MSEEKALADVEALFDIGGGSPGGQPFNLNPQTVDFSTSDVDMGGFHAPLQHVSMSEVHKRISSSPADIGTNSPGMLVSIGDDNTRAGHEDFYLTSDIENLESQYDTNQGLDVCVAPIDSGVLSLVTPADLTVSDQYKQPQPNKETLEANAVARSEHETDKQRKKRLYEEDQKKKWEGIDQWLYDEYHDYVELI